jgi:hypothetical protein
MSSQDVRPRIVLLANSWLEGDRWGPFHQSLIGILAAVSEDLVVVRANSFFHPWSDAPLSPAHEHRLSSLLAELAPDLIFSINRAALSAHVVENIPADTRILTLFIDYYDRVPDELKAFDDRDFVWGTGIGWLRDNFVARYSSVLSYDQIEFTLWASDTFRFRPQDREREIGVLYVGSPIHQRGFGEMFDYARHDSGNLEALLDVYFEHRRRYVHDIVAALERRGFDFEHARVEPFSSQIRTNWVLQSFMSDQITCEARLRYLSALAEDEFDLRLFGSPESEWLELISLSNAKLLRRYSFRPVEDVDELVELYNRAKIGLNVQHHHAHDVGLSMRVFDILACGSTLLTHNITERPLAELGFESGKHYVQFGSPDEAQVAARDLLADDQRREEIGRAAAEKLLSEHSLTKRMSHVFARAGMGALAEHVGALTADDVEATRSRVAYVSDPEAVGGLARERYPRRRPEQPFPRTPSQIRAALGRALPDELLDVGVRVFRNWFLDVSLRREPGRSGRG